MRVDIEGELCRARVLFGHQARPNFEPRSVLTRTRRLSLTAAVLTAAFAISGCGSSDDASRAAEGLIDPSVVIEISELDNGKTLEMAVGQVGVIVDAPAGEEVNLKSTEAGVVSIGVDDQSRPSILADKAGSTTITVRCCPEPANPGWVWDDLMTFTVNVS